MIEISGHIVFFKMGICANLNKNRFLNQLAFYQYSPFRNAAPVK